MSNQEKLTDTQLTSTGDTDEARVAAYKNITYQYTITGISGSLVVNPQASVDGQEWFDADENGTTTQTADGTYAFTTANKAYGAVRFQWVSGTATSVDVKIFANQ